MGRTDSFLPLLLYRITSANYSENYSRRVAVSKLNAKYHWIMHRLLF